MGVGIVFLFWGEIDDGESIWRKHSARERGGEASSQKNQIEGYYREAVESLTGAIEVIHISFFPLLLLCTALLAGLFLFMHQAQNPGPAVTPIVALFLLSIFLLSVLWLLYIKWRSAMELQSDLASLVTRKAAILSAVTLREEMKNYGFSVTFRDGTVFAFKPEKTEECDRRELLEQLAEIAKSSNNKDFFFSGDGEKVNLCMAEQGTLSNKMQELCGGAHPDRLVATFKSCASPGSSGTSSGNAPSGNKAS
ncbi:MAG: hypothetical protein H7837_13035 [Magnetococcus sp. MYC-9]